MADGRDSPNALAGRWGRAASVLVEMLLAAALLQAASGMAFAADAPLTITNLKSGLVCGSPQDRRVCFQANDIFITNESTCDYVGKEKNCTWFGYSFAYKLPEGQTTAEVDCAVQTDTLTDFGNPNAQVARNVDKMTYKIELSADKTSFFNAQYALSSPDDSSGAIEHSSQTCSYAGQTLFEIDFALHYPEP